MADSLGSWLANAVVAHDQKYGANLNKVSHSRRLAQIIKFDTYRTSHSPHEQIYGYISDSMHSVAVRFDVDATDRFEEPASSLPAETLTANLRAVIQINSFKWHLSSPPAHHGPRALPSLTMEILDFSIHSGGRDEPIYWERVDHVGEGKNDGEVQRVLRKWWFGEGSSQASADDNLLKADNGVDHRHGSESSMQSTAGPSRRAADFHGKSGKEELQDHRHISKHSEAPTPTRMDLQKFLVPYLNPDAHGGKKSKPIPEWLFELSPNNQIALEEVHVFGLNATALQSHSNSPQSRPSRKGKERESNGGGSGAGEKTAKDDAADEYEDARGSGQDDRRSQSPESDSGESNPVPEAETDPQVLENELRQMAAEEEAAAAAPGGLTVEPIEAAARDSSGDSSGSDSGRQTKTFARSMAVRGRVRGGGNQRRRDPFFKLRPGAGDADAVFPPGRMGMGERRGKRGIELDSGSDEDEDGLSEYERQTRKKSRQESIESSAPEPSAIVTEVPVTDTDKPASSQGTTITAHQMAQDSEQSLPESRMDESLSLSKYTSKSGHHPVSPSKSHPSSLPVPSTTATATATASAGSSYVLVGESDEKVRPGSGGSNQRSSLPTPPASGSEPSSPVGSTAFPVSTSSAVPAFHHDIPTPGASSPQQDDHDGVHIAVEVTQHPTSSESQATSLLGRLNPFRGRSTSPSKTAAATDAHTREGGVFSRILGMGRGVAVTGDDAGAHVPQEIAEVEEGGDGMELNDDDLAELDNVSNEQAPNRALPYTLDSRSTKSSSPLAARETSRQSGQGGNHDQSGSGSSQTQTPNSSRSPVVPRTHCIALDYTLPDSLTEEFVLSALSRIKAYRTKMAIKAIIRGKA